MPIGLRIVGAFMAFILLIGSLLSPAQAKPPTQGPGGNNAPPIELLARTFVPQPGVDPALQNQVLAQATGRIHVLLQLDYIPTEQQRAALAAQRILHFPPLSFLIMSVCRFVKTPTLPSKKVTYLLLSKTTKKYSVYSIAANPDASPSG
jgi:hypothetical protein